MREINGQHSSRQSGKMNDLQEPAEKINPLQAIFCVVVLILLFFSAVALSRVVHVFLCRNILTKHYTDEQIARENLNIDNVDKLNKWIEVSNGDILPQSEYAYYVSRHRMLLGLHFAISIPIFFRLGIHSNAITQHLFKISKKKST